MKKSLYASFLASKRIQQFLSFICIGAIFCESLYLIFLIFGPVYLPHLLADAIQSTLQPYQVRYEAKKIHLDGNFRLIVENPSFLTQDQSHMLAFADECMIDLKIIPLCLGQINPKAIQIKNGFYTPLDYSKPLVEHLYLDLKKTRLAWKIRTFNCLASGIPVVGQGQLPPIVDISLESTVDWSQDWIELLTSLEDPYIRLQFSAKQRKTPQIDFYLAASALQYHSHELGPLSCKGQLVIKQKTISAQNDWRLSTDRWIYDDEPHIHAHCVCIWAQPSVSIDLRTNPIESVFPVIHISTANWMYDNKKGNSSWAKIVNWSMDTIYGRLQLIEEDSFLYVNGQIDFNQKLYSGDFSCIASREAYQDWLPGDVLRDWQTLPSLAADGHAYWGADEYSIDFHLNMHDGQWRGLNFDHADLQGIWQKNKLKLDDFRLIGSHYDLNGLGDIDFDGPFYVELKAHGDPVVFNPYLPEWWSRIWPPLHFSHEWPSTHLSIHGNWKDASAIEVMGMVKSKKLSYQGVRMDQFSTQLFAKNQHVTLGPFEIEINQYKGKGGVTWLFEDQESKLLATGLSYEGDLPLEALQVLPTVDPIMDDFKCSSPPFVVVQGQYWPHEIKNNYVDLSVDCPQPLTYLKIPLDFLHFKAQQAGDTIHIDPIAFGIAQGIGSAQATVSDIGQNEPQLSFNFAFRGANRDFLIDYNPYLIKLKQSLIRNSKSTRPLIPGFVDLNLNASGPLNHFWGLSGQGLLRLKDAAMSGSDRLGLYDPFKIGSFEIREAVCPFTLNQGTLRIESARLSGPTSRVLASGMYDLITDKINLQLQLFPFAEVPVLSTAFYPLRPFSKVFEVKVSGSLSQPQWNLKHLPTN